MPAETNTNRIAALEKNVATVDERLDNLRRDVDRVTASSTETRDLLHDLEKRFILVARDQERLEKKLDELLARRWELWKLVLAGILGAVFTVAVGILNKTLERRVNETPKRQDSTVGSRPGSLDNRP